MSDDTKPAPAPLELDPSFLTPLPAPDAVVEPAATAAPAGPGAPLDQAPAQAAPAGKTLAEELGLEPLDPAFIPEKLSKHVDPNSPPPARLMGARAMVPMAPKDMVHVVYQAMLDPEPKIAAVARKTFDGFDERILNAVLSDFIAPQVLLRFAQLHTNNKTYVEKILLNRQTPDAAYVYVGRHAEDGHIVGIVAGNQERLLRCHDIVRGIADNPKALRSVLDNAIDFLVREGVFLEDVPEFEDSFLRLGKSEMLAALKKVKLSDSKLTADEKRLAAEHNISTEDLLLGNHDAVAALLEAGEEGTEISSGRRSPLNSYSIPEQIKLAMVGDHARALEALQSSNRLVASAGIRNPRITDNDIQRIVRSRSMHDDVIRYICGNNDWTKSYTVKLCLVQHPKTPPTLVMRWMPLLRQNDLRSLSKSKQIPNNVSTQAKRLLSQKEGGRR